ncbi:MULTISPECIES: metal-sensitive transcriptional regulator [Pseudofrankia]|uniref:metal-sensitive transcriptional regulator n=1 Tax=Pseudofrankia TaxID=2994363 RepID=UPI000234C184|nr:MULTISPECIES: metal-sensitive transcriptional regulator [Pseudofrankia]OHV41354.1 hypothetical protein BCD49_07665 [Pseudofrankia sp. EUN1h]
MQADEAAVADVIKRLRRAEGQIRGIIGMIEDRRDCAEVITQLAAVSRALDRTGFKIISTNLRQCLAARENGEQAEITEDELEKLFLSLA